LAISTPRNARSRYADAAQQAALADAAPAPVSTVAGAALLGELRREVKLLGDADLEIVSNCEPWTVRRLASHALNNQLFWAGLVTGAQTVTVDDVMGAVPYEGDLAAYADEVPQRAQAMWATDGVLTELHATPFGELPGSVVINFATIDALCHAWDLSASLGRPLEFPRDSIPAVTAIVDATCTDDVRALGLIKPVQQTAPDASDTDRLMAKAGRSPN
jgi:uncharacterized protein (TIGR03086 family)